MGAVTSASACPFWTAVAAACSDSNAATPALAVCLPKATSGVSCHIEAIFNTPCLGVISIKPKGTCVLKRACCFCTKSTLAYTTGMHCSNRLLS